MQMTEKLEGVSNILTKTQFFIVFWTLILGPFEYYVLGLPFLSVVLIRLLAVGSNLLWYRYWFERRFWTNNFIVRIARMVSMKFLVNITNFTILFCITMLLAGIYETGLHFTLLGFMKKVAYVTGFAVLATWPYEKLLAVFGFESNQIDEVDLTSDI
jgi:hypothetical protein